MQSVNIETVARPISEEPTPQSVPRAFEKLALPQPPRDVSREVNSLPSAQCLYSSGEYQVFVARSKRIPQVMLEIGRLREESFRDAGEGTGDSRDLDGFDAWYDQLFVWQWSQSRVVGAYRLARTEATESALGLGGLYSSSLFRYDESFLRLLGPAIELGRSFVSVQCQGLGRVLALLWRGIGRYIARYPECRKLLGPVSISSTYNDSTRRLIATQLLQGKNRHSLSNFVKPMHAMPGVSRSSWAPALTARQLSRAVAEHNPTGCGLPVLVSEYLKLGGQFCDFSLDPEFGNTLDGLVVVDLEQTNPRLLSLYMGEKGYRKFHSNCFEKLAC